MGLLTLISPVYNSLQNNDESMYAKVHTLIVLGIRDNIYSVSFYLFIMPALRRFSI